MIKTIAIVWLWYVWLPLAYHFAKAWYGVIWLDISEEKLTELRNGLDSTNEIGAKIKDVVINYTNDKQDLIKADMIIVTVPTPVNENKDPDYSPLISASNMIWSILRSWQIVVYESTVDPW
jgi:UDP-N-acetyl-D-galactosamine dehydrogenase